MSLPKIYVQSYGQIGEFLRKLQDGQAPDQFTQQHLKDLGFASSNHRAFIPLLKDLGFLTPAGVPTPRYHEFRGREQARRVLGEALKDAYSDIFVLKENPTKNDRGLIEGKFKSTHNVSDRLAQLMSSTFFSLLDMADLKHVRDTASTTHALAKETEEDKVGNNGLQYVASYAPVVPPPGLHYNIQIHLPATKDIEVFNAIFRSLKEHLID